MRNWERQRAGGAHSHNKCYCNPPKEPRDSSTLRNDWAAKSCGMQSSQGSQTPTAPVSCAVWTELSQHHLPSHSSSSFPDSVPCSVALQQHACACAVPCHLPSFPYLGVYWCKTTFQYLKTICMCLHKFNWLYFVQDRSEPSPLPLVV